MKNNSTIKRILISILAILLIGGVTVIIIKEVAHYQEIQAKREAAEERAEKIKEKQSKKSEEAEMRYNVALWAVQNLEGEKPITDIKVGSVNSYGIGGTGGSDVDIMINNENKNIINVDILNCDTPSGGVEYGPHCDYEVSKKTNKNMNLRNVTVEPWKGH